LDDLKKLPFTHADEEYEVWVLLDREKHEFRIAVRKDSRPLLYRLTTTGWMKLSYHVSFETVQDAIALQAGSALEHMIQAAQADLNAYQFQVSSSEANG
jgi:hypothetical protein